MKWLPIDTLVGTKSIKLEVSLLQSMAARGQILPIVVRPIKRVGLFWFMKTRMYEIIDGFRRVDAAKRLNWTHVAAQIVNTTDDQLLQARIIASWPYLKTDPAQYRAALLKVQVMHPDMTRDELAVKLGWSREKLDKELDDAA